MKIRVLMIIGGIGVVLILLASALVIIVIGPGRSLSIIHPQKGAKSPAVIL